MKKVLTIIFDGFGLRDEEKGNAIKAADMPNFHYLWNEYPHTLLKASEEAVGLKEGQAGNSEVGHMTIGAGCLLKQNEILVDEFLAKPDMEDENVIKLLEQKDKTVHIMGLCSDGNVHAGVDDFLAMHTFLVDNGFKEIVFHLITDGRDTGIHEAYKYIKMIEKAIEAKKVGTIATVCGRYYAMDRDKNWNRTKEYYDLVVKGKGNKSLNIEDTIKKSYAEGITDEFLKPIILAKKTIKNGDVLVWMNYRADRAKQILNSIVNHNHFSEFETEDLNELTCFTMMPVDKAIKTNHFLEPSKTSKPLGIYLSELEFTQARISESEKYAHVTYFFDGGKEEKIPKCDKIHVPSPSVATYDLKPEMSCVEVTKKVISCMENDYDFILVNYANPDMVGHTGNMEATTKACTAIDICLGKLIEKADENFYKIILLADHGNADTMINEDGSPCTTHSCELVPFIICDKKVILKAKGDLTNVAPTILDYMDIAVPKEMENTASLLTEE